MATLTTQNIVRAGIQESLVAAAGGGDAVECGPGCFLKVLNGGGSPITVTLNVPASVTYQNEQVTSRQISVTNAQHRLIPVGSVFRSPTTGLASITYSGVTTVTVGAFKVPLD